jgi:plasmid maintenance system antidote protein VapI
MENNQIRTCIREKFKTDAAFGFAIGWTTQKVSKLVNGTYTPKISEAVRLSRALEISLDELASFFAQ